MLMHTLSVHVHTCTAAYVHSHTLMYIFMLWLVITGESVTGETLPSSLTGSSYADSASISSGLTLDQASTGTQYLCCTSNIRFSYLQVFKNHKAVYKNLSIYTILIMINVQDMVTYINLDTMLHSVYVNLGYI